MGRRGAPPSDDDDVEITVCNPRRGGSGAAHTSPDGAQDRRRSSSGGNGGGSQRPTKAMEEEFRPFRRWAPFMTPLFVVANILLFAVAMYVNDCPKRSSSCIAPFLGRFAFQPLTENPLFGPSSPTLLKMGALEESKTTGHHQGWRLVTCIWLHAGLVHLLANMLSLIFIGIRLEQEFGLWRIGPLYVISGIGGSLMSGLFIESTISVGASGALFGLLGAMLSELIANWTIYANKVHCWPGIVLPRLQWKQTLLMVPLPELRPLVKLELQAKANILHDTAKWVPLESDMLQYRKNSELFLDQRN